MKTRARVTLACALCVSIVSALSAKVSIIVNSSLLFSDPTLASCALIYLGGRAEYYETHPGQLPAPGNVIPPSFGDELIGFEHTIEHTRELKAKKEEIPKYWEKMSAVEEAGFLKEYLVVFRNKQPTAEERTKLKIDDFKTWAKKHLKGVKHDEVERYGIIGNES